MSVKCVYTLFGYWMLEQDKQKNLLLPVTDILPKYLFVHDTKNHKLVCGILTEGDLFLWV